MRRISTAQWFLVPVICGLLILLAGVISFYIRLRTNDPVVVSETITENASYWLLWALISPLLLLLALRFPFERTRLLRSLLIHVLACLICANLIQILHLLVVFILNDVTAWQLEQVQGQPLSWIGSVLPNMLVYWIILIIRVRCKTSAGELRVDKIALHGEIHRERRVVGRRRAAAAART